MAPRAGLIKKLIERPGLVPAAMVHTFWARVGALRIDVGFEYVRSAANIADWPSRDKLDFVAGLGARV